MMKILHSMLKITFNSTQKLVQVDSDLYFFFLLKNQNIQLMK
jgi:hypothetical protein